MRLVRRMLKLLGWTVAVTVTLAALAIGGLYIYLSTDAGRERVRATLQDALAERTRGDVEVGRLTGSVLGDITLHDVVIRDPSGEPAVRVDSLRVDYSLRPLLSRTFHADAIVARGLRVRAERNERGELNLANLLVPAEEGPPWTVRIESLRIADGRFELVRPGADDVTVVDLELESDIRFVGADGTATIGIDRLAGRWRERDTAVTARADVTIDGPIVEASSLSVASGDSRIDVTEARFNTDTGALRASLSTRADRRELRRFAPAPWLADVHVDGTIERDGADAPIVAELSGDAGSASVDVSGRVWPERPEVDATVTFDAPDPSAVIATAPDLPVSGEVRAQLRDGTVRAEVRGEALSGTVRGDVVGRLMETPRTVEATVVAEAMRYEQARVGRAELVVELRDTPEDLHGSVTVEADDVRSGANRVDRLVARLDFERGGARVDGMVRAGARRDPYWVRIRGSATRGERRTQIRMGAFTVGTRSLTWRGSGRVTLGPDQRVRLHDVRLASSAGAISVSGLVRGGRSGNLELTVDDLDLAAARAAVPAGIELPPVRGRLDLRARARLGDWQLDADGRIARVVWRSGAPPLSGDFTIDLADRKLVATADLTAPRTGRAKLAVELETPRDPTSAAAWTPFRRDWIEGVDVELRQLRIARAAALVTEPPEIDGIVTGRVVVRGAADELRADVRLRDLRDARIARPLDIDLVADGSGNRIEGRVALATGGDEIATAEGELRAAVSALWRRPGDATARPIDVTVTVPSWSIRRIGKLMATDLDAVEGRVYGSVRLRGTIDDPRARIALHARNAGASGFLFTAVDLDGRVTPDGWQVALDGTQRAGGTIMARASGELDPDAAIDGRFEADALELGFLGASLRHLTDVVGRVDGRLAARVDVAGSLAAPNPSGWLRLEDGLVRFRERIADLRAIELELRVNPGTFRVQGSARSRGGSGRVELAISGQRDGATPTRLRGRFDARRMPFIAAGAKIVASVGAKLEGERATDAFELRTDIDRGYIRLPKKLRGRELHETKPLEDVVYDDERDRRAADAADGASVVPGLRVRITTSESIRVKGDGDVDARVTADLTFEQLRGQSSLRGSIRAERGTIKLFDRDYDILRARVSFDGDQPISPRFDVRLAHRFDRATVYVDAFGTPEDPAVELSSDPAIYSRAELLGFVLGGDPGDRAGDRDLTAGAASAASAMVAGKLENLVEQRVPIDTVRFGTEDETPGALSYVTIGKRLTDDLSVAYRRRFEADETENANEAEVEYELTPRWILEGRFGDRAAGSLDLLWVKRFDKKRKTD